MKLAPAAFVSKWTDRFRPNTVFRIEENDFQEFALDIADTFGVTVANVPYYVAGTSYTVGYLVRYMPVGGKEGFYYALTAGKLTAPGPGNLIDWKVVPGPIEPTALSHSLTLSQAQGLDRAGVVAGRTYLIDCGPDPDDPNRYPRTVTVRGIADDFYDVDGTLEVNGKLLAITDFNVQAGTWKVRQNSDFKTGIYTIQAADLPEPAITVPNAAIFTDVGIEGSPNPLAYGVGYTSSGSVLTILAAANPQVGEKVHYKYLLGSVAAGYSDPQAAAAAAAALVAGNSQHQGVQASVVGGQVVLVVGTTAIIRVRVPAPGAGNVATDGMDYRDAGRQARYKLISVVNVASLKIVKQGPTVRFDGPPATFPAAGLQMEEMAWYTYTLTPADVNQAMYVELVAVI